jgi:hypothetical protein
MNNKIRNLLAQAESQAKGTAPQQSSVVCASCSFLTEEETRKRFDYFKQKLSHIREWNGKSGLSSYELFDENGNSSHRKQAIIGDFIRITLHGSSKSDWVKILDIHAAADEVVLTVKPFFDPTEEQTEKDATSHFFTSEATNNFCLERKEKTINFCVIGLSEKTNTDETKNFVETVRNFATANLGSYLGIQKSEWKTFCENFLDS